MQFEWDEAKAASNYRKHGVTFAAALLVFEDLLRLEESEQVGGEQRWITIGTVHNSTLFVVFTFRGQSLRIISARRAEPHERREYWKNRLFHS